MRFDPFKLVQKVKNQKLSNFALDMMINIGIPFNRWLGLHIMELTESNVRVELPDRILRKNHVGSAHACALALLGEFPAGLLVGQKFPIDHFRFIIKSLHVDYEKQGRGRLYGEVSAPSIWPDLSSGEAQLSLTTKITNEKSELIASCQTLWQIKKWELVRSKL